MSKPLPPYWAELGYTLDQNTGLFHRKYLKADGTMAHEVCVDAQRFHRTRRENLRRLTGDGFALVAQGAQPSAKADNTPRT